MSSIKFTILPAPELLKNDVECFRIAEYTGEEGLAIKVSPNGVPGIVFQQSNGIFLCMNMTVFYKYSRGCKYILPTR